MPDACVVGSYIIPPQKFFMTDPNTNTIQADLQLFKPDKNGANPDYSGYSGNGSFFSRRFYTSNTTLQILGFVMTFTGNPGTSSDFNQALISNKLRIYIRRQLALNLGQTGPNATPLSLHGVDNQSGAFTDASGGIDTLSGAIGETKGFQGAGTNFVNGTFGSGSYAANTGFYADFGIFDDTIEIDTVNVTLNMSDSSQISNPVS
jgi:hypothetical protein